MARPRRHSFFWRRSKAWCLSNLIPLLVLAAPAGWVICRSRIPMQRPWALGEEEEGEKKEEEAEAVKDDEEEEVVVDEEQEQKGYTPKLAAMPHIVVFCLVRCRERGTSNTTSSCPWVAYRRAHMHRAPVPQWTPSGRMRYSTFCRPRTGTVHYQRVLYFPVLCADLTILLYDLEEVVVRHAAVAA